MMFKKILILKPFPTRENTPYTSFYDSFYTMGADHVEQWGWTFYTEITHKSASSQ